MGFYEYKCGDRRYLKSDLLLENEVVHGFTSAEGGVSRGRICGFNLGFRVHDDESAVRENYRLLAEDLGISLDRTVLAKQTHTKNIRIVTEADAGKGIVRDSDIEDTDGLVCNTPNMALVVFSADCIPVLLYDRERRVIAAVHSGWRGTVQRIGAAAVEVMEKEFGSRPSDIVAAIGPGIGPCCFEFGSDAPEYFERKYLTEREDGKFLVDIWEMNRDVLTKCGLKPQNIDISGVCTVCNSDRYYSYRTHKDKTGRQAAVIMLKPR